jgi:hypothetical protein
MKNNLMSPAILELERGFKYLNDAIFDNSLPSPVITIQSRGRSKNTLGWFMGEAWADLKEDEPEKKIPEITICAESLDRSTLEVFHTLIHEMVHLRNFDRGIKDCSKGGYHNKKFKEACEIIGLDVEKTKKGYSDTSLTSELIDLIKQIKVNSAAFDIFRSPPEAKKGPGSKLKKWSCGCTNIRVATELNAICQTCENPFVRAE